MKTSSDHLLTSHVGSLPRPDDLIAANRAREVGQATDEHVFQEKLRGAVAEVVRRQRELGIDVPGDGEFGKSMGHRVNYGAWLSYCFHRLGGLDLSGPDMRDMPARRSRPGEVVLTGFSDRRDRVRFAAAYSDPGLGHYNRTAPCHRSGVRRPTDLYGPRRDRGGHRQFQGGADLGLRRGGLHDLDRSGEHHADRQHFL